MGRIPCKDCLQGWPVVCYSSRCRCHCHPISLVSFLGLYTYPTSLLQGLDQLLAGATSVDAQAHVSAVPPPSMTQPAVEEVPRQFLKPAVQLPNPAPTTYATNQSPSLASLIKKVV